MARTRATIAGRGEATAEGIAETPVRGRGRGRARGRARGVTSVRGRARRIAPVRGQEREVSPEPQIEVNEEQALPEPATTPLLQDTLLRMMGMLENIAQGVGAQGIPQPRMEVQTSGPHQGVAQQEQVGQPPVVPTPSSGVQTISEAVLLADDQLSYERFQKMKPPQFQDAKNEDAHEFLTLCHEMLDAVGLVDQRGVRFVALQLRGPAREWWRTYVTSRPVGSPPVDWGVFSNAFKERFIPWSVREQSRLRFEDLTQGGMTVTEYEARFCQLSRHALSMIPNEEEKIRRFVRGLNFPIKSYVFKASREGASFQSIVSTAKEAELLIREEFRDPKKARTMGQGSGTSSGSRGFYKGGGSSQRQGPIHASLPASEGGQTHRETTGQNSYGSTTGPARQKFCYECGDPNHLMRQCPLLVGKDVPYNRSSVQTRPPAPPPYRGRGGAQIGRGGRVPGRGTDGSIVPQNGGRGITQTGGGRGPYCYAFPGRPEAEASDAVITGGESDQ